MRSQIPGVKGGGGSCAERPNRIFMQRRGGVVDIRYCRVERGPFRLCLPPVGSAKDDAEDGRVGSHDSTE